MTHSAGVESLQNQELNKRSYEPKHLPALDGVRGIAILLVILVTISSAIPLRDVRRATPISASDGSSRLIFRPVRLSDYPHPARHAQRFSLLPPVYIRRGLRIWPLYYVYVIVSLLLCTRSARCLRTLTATSGRAARHRLQLRYGCIFSSFKTSIGPACSAQRMRWP